MLSLFCFLLQVQTNGINTKKAKQQDQRRKRATKLVAIVVILFASFWLPIHVINLWLKLDNDNFPRTPTMYAFKLVAHTLSYANSCVNPIVYAYCSAGFRKAFSKTFPSFVQRFKLCREPFEDQGSQTRMEERYTEQTEMLEDRKVLQTDL